LEDVENAVGWNSTETKGQTVSSFIKKATLIRHPIPVTPILKGVLD